MGQCNSNNRPRGISLEELGDLGLNQTREFDPGCGPNIAGEGQGSGLYWLRRRGFNFPNNNEFIGVLGGRCELCSDVQNGYGCSCRGNEAIAGRRPAVRRISFQGNPADCCRTQQRFQNGRTCDPNFLTGYRTPQCDEHMQNFCNTGNNWTTNDCRRWVQAAIAAGRTSPNVGMSNFCSRGTNFNTPACQEWCRSVRNARGMQGACDNAVIQYCRNNRNDPKCACMESPSGVNLVERYTASSKACWFAPCRALNNTNFLTSGLENDRRNCATSTCVIQTGDIQLSGNNNRAIISNECMTEYLRPGETGVIIAGTEPNIPTEPVQPEQPIQPGQPDQPAQPEQPDQNNGNGYPIPPYNPVNPPESYPIEPTNPNPIVKTYDNITSNNNNLLLFGGIGSSICIVVVIIIIIILFFALKK